MWDLRHETFILFQVKKRCLQMSVCFSCISISRATPACEPYSPGEPQLSTCITSPPGAPDGPQPGAQQAPLECEVSGNGTLGMGFLHNGFQELDPTGDIVSIPSTPIQSPLLPSLSPLSHPPQGSNLFPISLL